MRASQIFPDPGDTERAAILAAVEELLRAESERLRPSAWKVSGGATSRRIGVSEARHRLGPRSWVLSARMTWSGEAPLDLRGRGDAS